MNASTCLLSLVILCVGSGIVCQDNVGSKATLLPEDEDWGDNLKVLTTFQPALCEHRAKKSDVIHYHYVGRLGDSGEVFGRSFDYNSPYIVSLGHGRIIAGMDRGLMNMCLWERRRITIPPHLGYGDRGVGQVIPPNATLVFYVRLIKIERNGHALGEDQRIEELWDSGLNGYSEENWELAIDMIEEAVRLFSFYENKTLICFRECKDEGLIIPANVSSDPLILQFLLYATRGRCVRECKARNLPSKLRSPDPEISKDFRRRLPYSYLHFAYYKRNDFENGAKCCFTFYHYNPTEKIAIDSIPFYRDKLQLKQNQFVFRDPGIAPHQEVYLKAKQDYEQQNWLESADGFEKALVLYQEALVDCYLMCEDIIQVNLTDSNMDSQKASLYKEINISADSMEYYELLASIMKEVLQCRLSCHERIAVIEGSQVEKYLSVHFHYLQYCYYKLGLLNKAANCAATYLALEPSDEVMVRNIQFYTSDFKISADKFVTRQEYIDIKQRLETEERLLHFITNGEIKKRSGQRGDTIEKAVPPRHQEL